MTAYLIIADPHLGSKPGDVKAMLKFINNLAVKQYHLIWLGDVFDIWAGFEAWHSAEVQQFLQALHHYTQAGGKTSLVVGNRDLFFKNHQHQWPFDTIAENFLVLGHKKKQLVLTHGDLVNFKDKAYTRLRRFVHSSALYRFSSFLPNRIGGWCMRYAEKLVQQVHPTTRHYIPLDIWKEFLHNLEHKHPIGLCVVGHFHLKKLVKTPSGQLLGLVLPDWRNTRTCLVVNSELEWQLQSCTDVKL